MALYKSTSFPFLYATLFFSVLKCGVMYILCDSIRAMASIGSIVTSARLTMVTWSSTSALMRQALDVPSYEEFAVRLSCIFCRTFTHCIVMFAASAYFCALGILFRVSRA